MRIKWGALVVVISCTATALAMAISKQGEGAAPDVVGVAERKLSTAATRFGVDQTEQMQPDFHFDLAAIKRTVPDSIQTGSLFQSKSWYVLPPPPPAPTRISAPSPVSLTTPPANFVPPPQPTAPPLPFTFIGRMIDGNEVTLFLFKNNQQYTVKLNDVLDNTYRVEKITTTSVVFTYLPIDIKQELLFNSTAIGASALNTSTSVAMIQAPAQPQQQIEISK